mmetsp:Transcript_23467/g.76314  ORF Transcript_23467/g.76314 Transcript_23467/m.76314 type:complete len:176 (+) Transcript_23467:36-563(+)
MLSGSDEETYEGNVQDAQNTSEIKFEEEEGESELTPDGLAYRVTTIDAEIEKFLEVDSWNHQHGFEDVGDDVEEKYVEELKTAIAAGDERRGNIKKGFEEETSRLVSMEMEIQALVQDLERVAKDANTAYEEEASAGKPASTSEQVNPYLEYRNISGGHEVTEGGGGGADDFLMV